MNNIWKYSLILCFTVIVDQLIKGTAQTVVPNLGDYSELASGVFLTRLGNSNFIFGIDFGLNSWTNTIAQYFDLILCFVCIWWIVLWRNIAPHKGWCLTLILTAIFSSWLDRSLYGYTLDYISLGKSFSSSIADLYLFFGCLGFAVYQVKDLRKKS